MTTFAASIAASDHDARENDAGAGYSSVGANLTADAHTNAADRSRAGLYFPTVTIPPGSKILTATLAVEVISTTHDDPSCDIHLNDVDDANDFTAEADVFSRAITTASAEWSDTTVGAGQETSPDFAAVVQEVIDRPGWAYNSAICIIVKGKDATGSTFRFEAWDASGTPAAVSITYIPPTVRVQHHRQQQGSSQ